MAGKTSSDPNVFILPDLGEGVHEAELISWKVSPGDTVSEHDIIAEMETDKALVEVPSPRDGTIKTLHGEAGEILNVGNPLVTYEGGPDSGSASAASQPAAPAEAEASAASDDAGTVVGVSPDSMPGMGGGDGKSLATPAVRRMARDLGVDLSMVQGSGIGGRITKKDVEQFAASGGAAGAKKAGSPSAGPSSKPSAPAAAPAPTTPAETRRPLPGASPQPQYPQPQYPQPAAQGYGQPYPQQGYPMPYGYAPSPYMMPMPYMPYPMPMPFPGYGMPGMPMPGQGPAGLPHAPGYTPSSGPRPIPAPAQSAQVQPGQDSASTPFRGVRKTIANRLRDSVNTAVHFTVVDEADVAALDALRREVSAQSGVKLSFLPFVGRAVCRALTEGFGALNATVDEANEQIVQHGPVHLGIATDTDSGLMVPVIPGAHAMDAVTLGQSIADTAKSARDRSIPRDRLMGSTFTISNVGSHAGKFATPVINAPEVAILAVGRVYDGVTVRDGQAVVTKMMPLSLACDHRVVDGATAALCLAKIVELLQNPEGLV